MATNQLPLREMIRALIGDFVHPPLHYFILRGWLKLFGFSLFQARLLSALFSSLSVVLLYFLAKYLFDRRTALFSSLLLATSQLALWYAQEARPYAQFHFLALSSSYLFVRAFREQRALCWWSFVGSGILMIYTDYFGVFVIAALALYALIYRKFYTLRRSWVLLGAAIALSLYIPWIACVIRKPIEQANKTFGGKQWYSEVQWFSVLTAVNSFNNGRPAGLRESSPLWTFVVGGLLFGIPMALVVKRRLVSKEGSSTAERRDREGVDVISILWFFPLCVVIGIGFTLHIPYSLRYVLFCAAPYYIFVARGISELPSRALRWSIVVLILAYSGNSLRANYLMRWKEDWTAAFTYVERNHKEGDCGIFLPFPTSFRISRNAAAFWGVVPRQWTITQARRPSPFRVFPLESLSAALSQCGRIWEVSFAPRGEETWWLQAESDGRPVETAYSKIDEKPYFGVRVSLYARKEK